jgi:L-aminopeptidase/D-esterase-like protein
MHPLKIGHYTQEEEGTGVTVFLFDQPAPGVYLLAGSAPASHELHTLELDALTPTVDGLVFVGGSAFGLSAVEGAMRWCKEQGRGYATSHGSIPIIPAAGIYDLAVKKAVAPSAESVYQACVDAVKNNPLQGRVGAGTGASVGKCITNAHRMSGGLGQAELTLPNGVSVLAYAVVNSVGDILDKNGNIIAGARFVNGEFADCTQYLLSGHDDLFNQESNTTLVALFTNARFSKAALKRISKMAIAGMARAISPAFTAYDGDIVFCFSLGEYEISEKIIGAMAAEAVRQAIMNAVKKSSIFLK